MAISTTYDEASRVDHGAQLRKAVVAATIGTTIEWYDFFLYGTAAGLIFGKLYFPNEDALTATLLYRLVAYWLPLPAGGIAV